MAKKRPAIAVRNPAAAAADEFVATVGGKKSRYSDVKTSKHSGEKKSEHLSIKKVNTSIVTRRDGTVVKRCSIYFPLEVKKALAIHAAETERDESDIVTEAVCRQLGIPWRTR